MVATPDDVLRESLLRAHRLLDNAAPADLIRMLQQSDRDLKVRLSRVAKAAGGAVRFSEAQMMAFKVQIEIVTAYAKKRLIGMTHEAAERSIAVSVRTTGMDLAKLDRMFSGVATPLQIREAAVMEGIVSRTTQSLLNQHATSVDRYGEGMIKDFRKLMARGLAQGVTSHQMVDALVGHGGPRGPRVSTRATVDPATGKVIRLVEEDIPEGLFVRKRYWAERVVRTEVAHGQNEARLRTIEHARATDFPDMGKKILAMMDVRTAMDSIGVHGQVRPVDGLFQDGAGRQYQRPPARPNDRETIVPWRLSWEETPYSAPISPAEVAKLENAGESPGQAKQVKIKAAQKAYQARLNQQARVATRGVHERIGNVLAKRIKPAIQNQRQVEHKTAVAEAKAKARVAKERAAQALRRTTVEAAQKSQRAATAQAQRAAAAKERVSVARAKARAYRAGQRADALVKAAERG